MSGLRQLVWVELKLFLRDPFATVFALVFPIIVLLLLVAVFGDTPPEDRVDGAPVFRGVTGADYYVAASVAIVIAALGLLILPTHIASYRDQGVLRRLRASGVSPMALFAAQLAVGLLVTLAGGALMVAIGTPLADAMLPIDPLGVGVAVGMTVLCFSAIGFALGVLLPTARAAQGLGLILFFTLWMLSGTAPPRAVLPAGVRRVGEFEPLTHAVIAIQDPWFGYGPNIGRLAVVGAVTVIAAGVGIWRSRGT